MHKKYTLVWFLLGLGSQLQILASLSISEAVVLLAGPFVFMSEFRHMKKTGVHIFAVVSVLLVCGCLMACVANHTSFQYAIRGLATTILLALSVGVAHRLFRLDMSGFRWFFLGGAISFALCTFIFQRYGELEAYGGGYEGLNAVKDIMAGPLFWIQRLGAFVTLPGKGWYLGAPFYLSAGGPLFLAVFSMIISNSGRSTALGTIATFVIVLIGGRKRSSMARLSRHFILLFLLGVSLIFLLNRIYRYVAESGTLGESAQKKYELQTRRGKDVLSLVLGGRSASFIGLLACRDKPILGWGPWALDEGGYQREFMEKYGTYEDYEEIIRYESFRQKMNLRVGLIECHSYIVEFWTWYGILGLFYWLYAIFVFIRYLRQDVAIVPQWFFWLAGGMPAMFFSILFSPLTDRIGVVLFIVACLMARAVRRGQIGLPPEMIMEIEKSEKR